MFDKILWYVRQLGWYTFRTTYGDPQTNERHFSVWRMWFGRCVAVDDVVLAEQIG
jgi:hypothetical protein